MLRFASPVQFDPRRATRAVRLHDVEIQENDFVLTWLGSANRDERVFERPETFDIARAKNTHLAFGFGTHYCIGANLARLEARVALGALLARTKGFERRGDELLPLHPSPVFRGDALPLRLFPSCAGASLQHADQASPRSAGRPVPPRRVRYRRRRRVRPVDGLGIAR